MNTEHTNQPKQAAEAAFEQWWQRHGLEDPMDDEDRYYITASSWARRGYMVAAQQLELERGTLLAETERKQQLQGQIEQLLNLVKSFGHKAGCAKNAFGEQCTCGVDEAIAAAEQVTLCASCARANVDCPVYPQQTASCVEHRPAAQQQAEPVALSLPFFAYDSETGFERFATEAKAKAAAQESIDTYREEAGEGWAEAVENICWGVVLGTTREVALPDEYSGGNGLADSMKPVDYVLTDAAQPPAVAVPDERATFEAWLQENIDDTDTVRPSNEKVDAYFAVWLARAMLAAAPQATAEDSSVVGDAVAVQVAHPCWSCGRLVTAERRAAADGDCPNCGAELDHEDWPAAAQKGGAA